MKLAAIAIALLLFCVTGASAATLDPIGDFDQPIFVTSSPADPDELFVVEREGRVMRVGEGGPSTFADLTGMVSCCESERGLLSIALPADFDTSGRLFAAYAGNTAAGGAEGDIHVDAFRRDGAALVREPLLSIGHAANANHNGGQLQIGPDGYLYVSTGDGGGSGDPLGSGQSLATLLGKILRIEPRPGAEPQIWSYGLRNPWRFSFDRDSGDMVIADVGQGTREEIDLAPSPAAGLVGGSGANYGWSCREGFLEYPGAPESCEGAGGFTEPVFDYPHTDPEDGSAHGCSITGGYVVRDPSLGDLFGRYVYADFCVGEIRSLILPAATGGTASGDRSEGLSVASPVSFGEDSCGRLYVVARGGTVYRLQGATPAACAGPPTAHPGATGVAPSPSADPLHTARRPQARLRLGAKALRARGKLKLTLTARLVPCADNGGRTVQLNRGGRRIASKRLNGRCVARFHREIKHRSTFRALLPAGGYRSQVLTIALAKPRP